MCDTTDDTRRLDDDLTRVSDYLDALAHEQEAPELDPKTVAPAIRRLAESALAMGGLVREERAQAERLAQGDFTQPEHTGGENPLTERFDEIRMNLAVPYKIARGVAEHDYTFAVNTSNRYRSYLGGVAAQMRDQRLQLESRAYKDSLTGLGNRAAYDRDLEHLWNEKTPYTVAFIDLDGLKHCNDHYGHAEGNQYILQVAHHLDLHRRPDESLYRIGGDEFMLISPNDSREGVEQRLEGCRSTLGTMTMGTGQTPFSFSYGCTHADPACDEREQVAAETDRRMYRYKVANSARRRGHKPVEQQRSSLTDREALRHEQDRIFQAMALTSSGRYLFVCNVDTDQSYWSHNVVRDFGLPAENMYQIDRVWAQHIHPDDVAAWRADIDAVFAGKKHRHNMRYRAKDASGRYVMVSCAGIRLDGGAGEPTLFVGTITNSSVVESTDPTTGLDDARALIAAIEERRRTGVPTDFVTFKLENIDRINAVYGYEAGNAVVAELTGRILSCPEKPEHLFSSYGLQYVLMFDSRPDQDPARVADTVRRALAHPVTVQGDEVTADVHVVSARYSSITEPALTVLTHLNRRIVAEQHSKDPENATCALIPDENGLLSEQRDKMSGLMRGNDFLRLADRYRRDHPGESRAIVALDLGHMRIFNEWYGRQAGDSLIAEVGSHLHTIEARGLGLVGYWGQDDFVAYIPNDREMVEELYRNVSSIVSSRDDSIGFLPAFGVCPVDPAQTIDIVLYDHAKAALGRARNDFKERIKYFDPRAYVEREREHRLLTAFQHALNEDKVSFYIQPQYNIESEAIAGGEALARWRLDDGSFVSPGTFVPILERNGFAVTLDRHIWNLTFAWLSKRVKQGLPCVPISINVSQSDLISLDVAEHLDRLAMHYAVPTRYVKVEITESAYADDPDAVRQFVDKLHARGFSVFIDDFGSGSSTLSMLQAIEVDAIKLDGRFMALEASEPGKNENIVESIVTMAWNIGLPVVVEGVETAKQVEFLKHLGCRYVQGFHYCRPVPTGEFERMLGIAGAIDPKGIVPPADRKTQ